LFIAAPAWAQAVPLTILHTNDTHGHLLPFSYPDSAAGRELQGLRTYKDIGGIARRATLVKRIRQEQQARRTAVWLADVGDYSDGTPFSIEYHGEADVAAMNAAGYDLGTLGNHEFNNPAAAVRQLIAAAKYQLVSANITDRASGKRLLPAYVVRRVGPVRVGVFGLTTREAATYPAGKEAFDVADEIESARATVAALRRQADIVVLLSHAGEDVDEKIAADVPGIDVIVGGHSHSRLPSGTFVWRSEDLRASDVNGTVIVQAHQWGGEVGRLDLLFVRDAKGVWHVDRYRARLLPVTADLPPDPGVAAVVDRFWKPISVRYGEVVGQAAGEFSSRGDDAAEYNLMADALRESFGADFAVENTGGIRAPLLRGAVTRGDLVTLDPFNNTVVLFTATGRQIRQLLERYSPSVSGLRYRVQDKKLVEATIGGQPLDDDKSYKGVTNSYFAGYALKGIASQDTGKPRLETLAAYIRQKGTIAPAYDGRRVVIRN
jgi:2',3'-cyclic-nucleotide 2'-phosphodiesterase (5'-nucleotidase family)